MPVAAKAGSALPELGSAAKAQRRPEFCKRFSSYNDGENGKPQQMGRRDRRNKKPATRAGFVFRSESSAFVSRMILTEKSATFRDHAYMPRPS
jgi:hypothetical protein